MAWIPLEERVPEENQEVLITLEIDWSYGRGTDIKYEVDIATFSKFGGYISTEYGYFDTPNDWLEGQPCDVVAWLPLPEPYKKEEK